MTSSRHKWLFGSVSFLAIAISGEVAMKVTRREFLLQSGHACFGYALGAAAFVAGVQRFSLINAFAQDPNTERWSVCSSLAATTATT